VFRGRDFEAEDGADTAVVYRTEVEGKRSAPALYRALGIETKGRHVTMTRTLEEERITREPVFRPR
jgi:hypothetical protein